MAHNPRGRRNRQFTKLTIDEQAIVRAKKRERRKRRAAAKKKEEK